MQIKININIVLIKRETKHRHHIGVASVRDQTYQTRYPQGTLVRKKKTKRTNKEEKKRKKKGRKTIN